MSESLVERLRKRAEIRRSIVSRKSVQEGKPDRISDLLEEAADMIDLLQTTNPGSSVFTSYFTQNGNCGLCGRNTCSGGCFK